IFPAYFIFVKFKTYITVKIRNANKLLYSPAHLMRQLPPSKKLTCRLHRIRTTPIQQQCPINFDQIDISKATRIQSFSSMIPLPSATLRDWTYAGAICRGVLNAQVSIR
ncbi:hypothetical protein, partial [Burkholderia ubonensis]|uniref:hypothetical protein n=1 Tax=Burkholderia ubonensis TaxID=101571 RepID=UPI001E58FB78